jgi:hypothetical protein
MPTALLRRLRYATCAVGWFRGTPEDFSNDPFTPNLQVIGTGFLVRKDVIFTARHVLQRTLQIQQSERFSDRNLVVAFILPLASGARIVLHYWGRWGWIEPPLADLGFILIDSRDPDVDQHLQPFQFPSTWTAEVGDRVGVFGYPYGTSALTDMDAEGNERVYRVGPVLNQGFISAIAPFEESVNVERLILDIRTYKGMSGGPVFSPASGEAIGLHYAGRDFVYALAVPLTSDVVASLLSYIDEAKRPERGPQHQGQITVPKARRLPLPERDT